MSLRNLRVGTITWALLLASGTASAELPVPKVLYHYGNYKVLMKDVRARQVPEDDWNHFIIGGRSRYQQKWYRRGLYGASHPAYASYFADISVGTGRQQWLMAFTLTDACRNEEPFNIQTLPQDVRMIQFIESARDTRFPTPAEFEAQCYPQGIPSFEVITSRDEVSDCEAFLSDAFEVLKPKVVVDHAWKASWYVRDRSCIESIQGTPEEVIDMMMIPGFWSINTPEGIERERSPQESLSLPIILLKALTEANGSRGRLEKLRDAVSQSDVHNPTGHEPNGSNENFNTAWLSSIGVRLISNLLDCQSKGQFTHFKRAADDGLKDLTRTFDAKAFEEKIQSVLEKTAC